MKEQVSFDNKWLEASKASFRESKDNNGKRKLFLDALIVPFGQVSRNGVKYNKERVIKTHKQLIGKTLNHNHITSGADVLPRGKWIESWIVDNEGMWGRAEVFDTGYNKDYIEWLEADKEPRVSLQVRGTAKQFKEETTGKWIKEAFIDEWLETSTVNLPGFDMAKGSLEVAMAEAFNNKKIVNEKMEIKKDFFNELNNIREKYRLGEYSKSKYRKFVNEIIEYADMAINETNDSEVFDDFKAIKKMALNIQKKLGEKKRPTLNDRPIDVSDKNTTTY